MSSLRERLVGPDGKAVEIGVSLGSDPRSLVVTIGDAEPVEVTVSPLPDGSFVLATPTGSHRVFARVDAASVHVCTRGSAVTFERESDHTGRRRRSGAGDDRLVAPMPGKVVEVACAPGDAILAGQALVVIEAMKLEMPVHASRDGVVAAVSVTAGDLVARADVLVVLEEDP